MKKQKTLGELMHNEWTKCYLESYGIKGGAPYTAFASATRDKYEHVANVVAKEAIARFVSSTKKPKAKKPRKK